MNEFFSGPFQNAQRKLLICLKKSFVVSFHLHVWFPRITFSRGKSDLSFVRCFLILFVLFSVLLFFNKFFCFSCCIFAIKMGFESCQRDYAVIICPQELMNGVQGLRLGSDWSQWSPNSFPLRALQCSVLLPIFTCLFAYQ